MVLQIYCMFMSETQKCGIDDFIVEVVLTQRSASPNLQVHMITMSCYYKRSGSSQNGKEWGSPPPFLRQNPFDVVKNPTNML